MKVKGYTINGNSVILDIQDANLPIVVDNYTSKEQKNFGFNAFDTDMNELIIKSVAVVDSRIVISFDSLPEREFYISYGSNGYGNIRDSDDWRATYKYSSNSLGNMSELSHSPLDQQGKDIIGHYYPMWNWLPFGYVRIVK